MVNRYFRTETAIYPLFDLVKTFNIMNLGSPVTYRDLENWTLEQIKTTFPGILEEVTKSITPEMCLKDYNSYILAIRIYKEKHNVSLSEARNKVDELSKSLKEVK